MALASRFTLQSPGGCREFIEGLGAVAGPHVHVQGVQKLQDVYRRSRTCSRSPCTCSGSPGGCREFMEGLGAVAGRHVHSH